eukprot:CAMPEP_0113308080 /NCGR_PEP_ID=MMETSP0010_2-20120614/6661_1 /TAXON_ID=216773 ORGANISM="Corethron hystrix, Strain 308" /NCGR_SAMPLE_ID=MMETSP0010_2 /ASSEMBLY_ACC=CAM_ASM_000155 /LENGTH=305 /DNA_ID=CAMNT_0000163049 /DNA_START=161 /DNA_END=1075 /DNA_ORIENTATION=+ /assembly_acc=CAM_ASM_000155
MQLPLLQSHFFAATLVSASLASAQDVVLGSGNACPSNRVKVTCSDGCVKAMKAAPANVKNSKWRGTENSKKWPSGCYFCDGVPGCTDGVWFNEHNKGRSNGDAAPLCVLPTVNYGCGDGSVDFLFAGDSDIDYWPDRMRNDAFPSSVNKGVAGWTCRKLKGKIQGFLDDHTPLWTVLVCGENDLGDDSVGKTFKNFKKVIKKIIKSGSRVLYIGTKPEPDTKNLHSEYRKYDQKIRKYANSLAAGEDDPPLVMVDSYKGFEDLGNPKSLYDKDKLHLSNEGYDYWTKWAKDAVDEANDESWCTVW